MAEDIFKGYTFSQSGVYTPAVELKGAKEVFNYCQLQRHLHYEVRIVEPLDDAIIVQTINGKYVYPKEWLMFNQ